MMRRLPGGSSVGARGSGFVEDDYLGLAPLRRQQHDNTKQTNYSRTRKGCSSRCSVCGTLLVGAVIDLSFLKVTVTFLRIYYMGFNLRFFTFFVEHDYLGLPLYDGNNMTTPNKQTIHERGTGLRCSSRYFYNNGGLLSPSLRRQHDNTKQTNYSRTSKRRRASVSLYLSL